MLPESDQRFLLLNDLPVEDSDADLLGTGQVAGRLADLVYGSRDNTPFVLAVDGGWGTGKSTLMRQLSAALRGYPSMRVVWFNAWTASGVNALSGVLKLVLAELDPSLVRRTFRRVSGGAALGGGLRLAVTLLAGFFRVDRAIDQMWERMRVDAKAREEARALVRDAVRSWVDQRGVPRRTIAVFIDDLDRCSDRTAVEICEVIKLYLDLPGIAFVLGCDLRVLSRMPVPGAEGATHVREYLEKIIQVNYQIPVPAEAAVRALINGYADRSRTGELLTADLIPLVGRQSEGNPRRIKRLINSFVAEYKLDPEWSAYGADALMKAVVLQHLYPDYYRTVVRDEEDTVGATLGYRHTRDWLQRPDRPLPADEALTRWAVRLPVAGEHGYDEEECRVSLAQLDERVPALWRLLVGNDDFIRLLDALGEPAERQRLQQRLRRRPLSTAPTATEAPPGGPLPLDGVRLLWLDDHPAGNESLINHLAARGAQIRTAHDVEEAIALLGYFGPNALVSDVYRHGRETGFDDVARLRGAGYLGPVFFFTGQVNPERRMRARDVGAAGITESATPVLEWIEQVARLAAASGTSSGR